MTRIKKGIYGFFFLDHFFDKRGFLRRQLSQHFLHLVEGMRVLSETVAGNEFRDVMFPRPHGFVTGLPKLGQRAADKTVNIKYKNKCSEYRAKKKCCRCNFQRAAKIRIYIRNIHRRHHIPDLLAINLDRDRIFKQRMFIGGVVIGIISQNVAVTP
ncbi:hypothetical protein [Paracoccus sp. (in: a-proteobacteria)]|uniref:hypothetical protein n=1 Tax=Paracoccus sp. TaxID=267 RepID=UPI003A8C47AE